MICITLSISCGGSLQLFSDATRHHAISGIPGISLNSIGTPVVSRFKMETSLTFEPYPASLTMRARKALHLVDIPAYHFLPVGGWVSSNLRHIWLLNFFRLQLTRAHVHTTSKNPSHNIQKSFIGRCCLRCTALLGLCLEAQKVKTGVGQGEEKYG